MSGFLIASGVSFLLTVICFIAGSYYVDKYVQLLALTNQHDAYTRATKRIGVYLFFLPAIFSYLGMKFIQIHSAITGEVSTTGGILSEMQTQTGGITLFLVTYGILLVGYGQLLIQKDLKKKVLQHIPLLLLFSIALIFISRSIIISLLISCILALGILIYTYRKSAIVKYNPNTTHKFKY